MDRYRELVKKLFAEKLNDTIANGTPQHAAVLYEAMFSNAQKNIRIFCNDLSVDVFGKDEVVTAAQDALNRGVKFEIAYLNLPKLSDFIKLITKENYNEKVEIYKATREIKDLDGKSINFAVMDSCGFRFENNKEECKAFASANRPDIAEPLIKLFDNMKS